ncbi:O-antigen ligase [Geobacter sp. OR-1]|uniref:O-antigen ligase family protein n=1 Tax=Geobacter sp. OR-1 TaxID=1266765 RepID=UPI001364911C|nr:O-antigen ligase family protein [Geobacter sp. OR-1]
MYYILFVGTLYLSTLISSYTDFSEINGSIYYQNIILQTMVYCICLYSVLLKLTDKEVNNYIKFTVFCFMFMAVWGIEQYSRGNTLVEQLFGTAIVDRCAITGVFVLYLPVSIYLINKHDKFQKYFGFLSFIAFISIIVLTQSRAGFLGFVLSFTGVYFFSKRKARMIGFAFLILITALPFIPDSYFERIGTIKTQDIHSDEISDYSSASRLLLWKVGLRIFGDHPVFGVGNLNFSKASGEYAAAYAGSVDDRLYIATFGSEGQRGLSHTHNTFVNILAEGGLLSAIPYYLMIFFPLWKGYKLNRKYRFRDDERLNLINMLNCGIAGFLVTAFFANLILIDFLYWNLTLSFFLTQKFEASIETEATS